MTWQAALIAWAIGVGAAFPSCYEIMCWGDDDPLPWRAEIGLALFAAALWPIAWATLIVRKLRWLAHG